MCASFVPLGLFVCLFVCLSACLVVRLFRGFVVVVVVVVVVFNSFFIHSEFSKNVECRRRAKAVSTESV